MNFESKEGERWEKGEKANRSFVAVVTIFFTQVYCIIAHRAWAGLYSVEVLVALPPLSSMTSNRASGGSGLLIIPFEAQKLVL